MKKIFLVVFLLLASFFTAQSQCLTVNDDGSVTFENLEDVLEFVQSGESSLPVNQSEFTDGGYLYSDCDANAQSVEFIISKQGEDDEIITENVYTVFVTADEQEDEIVLSWKNNGYDNVSYKVYRKLFSESDFSLVTTVTSDDEEDGISYSDAKISSCSIQYRIERVEDGCSSWSNTVEIARSDNEEPLTPAFKGIVVDEQSQKLNIEWLTSASEDTWGYVICKNNANGTRQTLDTVYGRDNVSYVCDKCSSLTLNDISVFAFDSCLNTSALTETYSNVLLSADRESCEAPITLTWNQNYPTSEDRYWNVYAAVNDGAFEMVVDHLGTTNYDYTVPNVEGKIKFYVTTSSDAISVAAFKSNIVTVSTDGADTLKYLYLNTVSVGEDNTTITLKGVYDDAKKISHVEIWRQMDKEDAVKVKDVEYDKTGFFEIEDHVDLPASEHTYTYFIAAPDACGSGMLTYSNSLTTMQLKIDATAQPKIKLSWNAYTPTSWDVEEYEVYRFAEGDIENAQLIGTTTAISYIDNTENMVSATDRTYYYVKAAGTDAMYRNGNGSAPAFKGFWDANSSNGYAKFESIFFIPNAFAPKEGVHQRLATFKPECHFVRSGTYTMKIYNRKGELLFETSNPDEGWDGTYKNEFCPVGTYVYKIKFVDSDGMEQNKGGAFMLFD